MSFDMNSPNPYAASTQPVAPKKSNVLLYVLGGIAAVFVICCLGCVGTLWWGGNSLMSAGMAAVGESLKPSLQRDPVVQEHLGDIKKVTMNFMESTEATQKSQEKGGPQRMVFDLEGSKASGKVIGTPNNAEQKLNNGELILKDGSKFPLSP
jgi:hypothetical protein